MQRSVIAVANASDIHGIGADGDQLVARTHEDGQAVGIAVGDGNSADVSVFAGSTLLP